MLSFLRKVPVVGYAFLAMVAGAVFLYFQVRRLQEEIALQRASFDASQAQQELARATAQRDAAQSDAKASAEHARRVADAENKYQLSWSRTVDARQRIASLNGAALADAVNSVFNEK